MASRHYQNFDLLIESDGEGRYRARVTSSPLGESPTSRFVLPFTETELKLLLMTLDPGRSGVRRSVVDPQSRASMDLGGPLFDAVFADDVMLAWSRSQDAARAQGDGLRLRLRLTDAPDIAGLPWELLYDRRTNSYLAQSERTPVVRYLEVPQPPRPLAVSGALRVLTVIAAPEDQPPLDVDREWRRVQEALRDRIAQGTVRVDRLPEATMPALREWLRRNEVHVLHFIGHGDYDSRIQDGVLCFTDRYGRSVRVTPSQLGPHLRDHDPLRLVVLNACHSARVDSTDPFSGMAQGLIQQDCAAVVAMQFPISDGAATAFTGEFYGALADGFPVDQAATSARKALMDEYAAEWATPVVFLRSPDGHLFTDIVADPDQHAVQQREAADREAAQRQEAGRQAAARQEASRQAANREEAARQQEAARQEAARQQEITRQEAARQEAARQEAARQRAPKRSTSSQQIRFLDPQDPRVRETKPWYRRRIAVVALVIVVVYLLAVVIYGVLESSTGSSRLSGPVSPTGVAVPAAGRLN
jgi:hypothetical protein